MAANSIKTLGLALGAALVACPAALAQMPIDPVERSAIVSAFADGDAQGLSETRYRPFDATIAAGGDPGSSSSVDILSGPTGPLAFEGAVALRASAVNGAVPGQASALASDELVFEVGRQTPFTLAARFEPMVRMGATGTAGSFTLEVVSGGSITLFDGTAVPSVAVRAGAGPSGGAFDGTLEPGRYRLRATASLTASARDGDAAGSLATSTFFATACRVDLNADRRVDIFDFLQFQILYFQDDPRADLTGDGQFDLFDFLVFFDRFEDGC